MSEHAKTAIIRRRRLRRSIACVAVSLIALVSAVVASTPSAEAAMCTDQPCAIELRFYQADFANGTVDPTLCDVNVSDHCHIELWGWLYLPHGRSVATSAAHLPLVVFVHGSTLPGTAPQPTDLADYFTQQGYAVFAIERRGHGRSTGDEGADPCTWCKTDEEFDFWKNNFLSRQVQDVHRAIHRLEQLRVGLLHLGGYLINPNRVAIIGHSLGGIISLYANTVDIGQRTVIDIAAGSEQWDQWDHQSDTDDGTDDGQVDGHGPVISQMLDVVSQHVTPPMFLQPTNDCSTVPTDEFSGVVADQDKVYEATLFGRSPETGNDCGTAHISFVFTHDQVFKWAPTVKAWLERIMPDTTVATPAPPPPPLPTVPSSPTLAPPPSTTADVH